MKSIASSFFAKLFIISGVFVGVTSATAFADSLTATDCVIQLGEAGCSSEIMFTSAPGKQFNYLFTNADAQADGLVLKAGEYQPSITVDASGVYSIKTRPVDQVSNLLFGLGYNTFGLNTITMKDTSGNVLATASARATCAPGLVWTYFSQGNGQGDSYGSNGSFLVNGKYKCVAPVAGAAAFPSKKPGQMVTGTGKLHPMFGDANYGAVLGYCPVGQKWSVNIKDYRSTAGKYTFGGVTETMYICLPNIDSVDASKVSMSISPTYVNQGADCNASQPEITAKGDSYCIGALTFNAPTERTYSLHVTSANTPWTGFPDGYVSNIIEVSHTDKRYTMEGYPSLTSTDFVPAAARLFYDKPVTYELRLSDTPVNNVGNTGLLGKTTLATITATPKVVSSSPCVGYVNTNCNKYAWTITTSIGTSGTTGTTNTTNTNYPSGCNSAAGYSTTTGLKCDGTSTTSTGNTNTGTTNNTNTTTTTTGSSSLSPANLSIAQVGAALNGVILKWTAPQATLARYKVSYVEYTASGVVQSKKLIAYLVPTATDYFISPLTKGSKYDIYISAVDTAGNESPESSIAGVYVATNSTTSTGTNTGTSGTTNTGTSSGTNGQQGDVDPNGSTGGACLVLSTDMRQGTRSDAVASLQDFLINANYLNAEATGYFGALTFKAVQSYQGSKGFTQSGYVGPLTRGAIQKDSCGS